MNKPQNWDKTESFTGEFKSIAPGGHVCKIIQAKQDFTKDGRELLVLMFDIAEGESKDFYKEQYDRRKATNPEAKWQGTFRQLTEGKSEPFYKGMITVIENSNSGYKWDFDEAKLKGKLFGGVFGQEEYTDGNGEIKLSTKCQQIRSVEAVRKGVPIPAIKRLNGGSSAAPSTSGKEIFPPEEEIPF